MPKENFINICLKNGISIENAKMIWDKFQDLEYYINTHWDICENLQKMSQKEQLNIRQIAAEKGIEWTPQEIKKMIDFLSVVQNGMDK
jgi:DNA relaxase NicK